MLALSDPVDKAGYKFNKQRNEEKKVHSLYFGISKAF